MNFNHEIEVNVSSVLILGDLCIFVAVNQSYHDENNETGIDQADNCFTSQKQTSISIIGQQSISASYSQLVFGPIIRVVLSYVHII